MEWLYRVDIFILAEDKDLANSIMAEVTGNAQDLFTFGHLSFSADGMNPPSHYACSTLATQGMVNTLRDKMIEHPELDAWVYRYTNDEDSQLVYTNSLTAIANLGESWYWSRTLTDMGNLQIIFPEDDEEIFEVKPV